MKDHPRPGKAPKLTDKQATHLIAVACSDAPDGHNHWTLRLLADKVVELNYANSRSYETIRQLLKNTLKPWQKQKWCIPEVSSGFVAAMEDVLDLYEEPYDPMRPVVCFDENPKQLIAEIELAVLSNMCLTQRIPDKDHLRREVEANVNARNAVISYFQRNFSFEIIREYFNYYSIL